MGFEPRCSHPTPNEANVSQGLEMLPSSLAGRNENGGQSPRFRKSAGLPKGLPQTENDDPHPHVEVAFGFLITNCAPSSPS
jgi:hypothetical protein